MGLFKRDPRKPVAVVDERTYRHAVAAVTELLDTDLYRDRVRAQFAIHAIIGWLRTEIHTGRRSKAIDRAARLEQWEMHLQSVNRALGLA
jgi:hypothetical protein